MTGHFVLPLDQAVLTKQNYWAEVKGIFKMPAPTLDEWWNIKCLLLKCKHFKFWQTIRCIKKNPAVIPQSLIGNHIKSILKRNWSEIHLASDLSLSHRSWPLKKVIHPSIHYLPLYLGPEHRNSSLTKAAQTSSFITTSSSSSGGIPIKRCNLSTMFWICPGASSQVGHGQNTWPRSHSQDLKVRCWTTSMYS